MIRYALALLACLALAVAVPAHQAGPAAKSAFFDASTGFSIEPPAFASAPDGPKMRTIAQFLGPGIDGFAPNVNIIVEPFAGTPAQYKAATVAQLKQSKMTLDLQRDARIGGRAALLSEFRGAPIGGKELRFLSAVVFDEARVFVITCTATPERFEADEKAFRDCIQSFKIR